MATSLHAQRAAEASPRGERLPGVPAPSHFWESGVGTRLAGDVCGEPTRPLVVLLHGGGQTRHAWKDTGLRLASRGYCAVTFDARGHGDSDWAPDGDYGVDAMVGDLACILQAIGGPPPVLVGASMGGSTSLVALGEGRVHGRALVLVDVAHRLNPEGVDRVHAFMMQRPEGFDSLDEVADAIASYQPHRPRPVNLDGLAKNVRIMPDGKYCWHWDPRLRNARMNLAERELRLSQCARALRLPTLLVRGGRSDVLTDEGVRAFLALCPHASYENVADAAHMVAGDRNDAFARTIERFMDRFPS